MESSVWISLLPAILLSAYFILGLGVYVVRAQTMGTWRDENLEGRPSTAILGMWIRLYFAWIMRPPFALIKASGMPADAITTLSTLLATAGAVALGAGHFVLGGWLMLFGGMCDFLDGRLARELGQSGKAGAALDSVLDRYSDAVVIGGLAWYYRETWMLLPVMILLVSSLMVSYTRAKGEGLGVDVKGGIAQRAERVVVLGLSLVFSTLVESFFPSGEQPLYWLVVAAVAILSVLATGTAVLRLVRLHNALGGQIFQGWSGSGEGSLWRHVVSAVSATGGDFVVVWLLVSATGLFPWAATALGCVVGAIINFSLNRAWTFKSRDQIGPQFSRYTLVSVTSALLNAGGVLVFMLHPDMDYRIAWLVARVLVFVAWNYPLQKRYVFGDRPEEALESPAELQNPVSTASTSVRRAASGFLVLLAIGATFWSPSSAEAGSKAFQPGTLDDGDYGESWTAVSDLEDGSYLLIQLAVSNIGPGDLNGVCRVLWVPASGSTWSTANTVDSDEWAFKGQKLTVGQCSGSAGKDIRIHIDLEGGKADLTIQAAPSSSRHPLSRINVGDDFYTNEILVRRANATLSIAREGQKAQKLSGKAYLDHTRATTLPGEMSKGWYRLRTLDQDGNGSLAVIHEAPDNGKRTGWIWHHGAKKPEKVTKFTTKPGRKGFTITSASGTIEVSTSRKLYRHAPVEEHGFLGAMVGAVVGNPVTYTYRATQKDQQRTLRTIVEMSVSDE